MLDQNIVKATFKYHRPLLTKHVLFQPSQNVEPSSEDIEAIFRRLMEAGKILGIEVLDHLIVNANTDFCILKEKGYI